MSEHTVTLVSNASGDWEALYVDGKLITEGHSVTARDVAEALGAKVAEVETTDAWMEKHSNPLPNDIGDVRGRKVAL